MASNQDLKEVLKETLENRGSLSEIRARIRAEVFSALDEQSDKPPLSNENVLIFELIREFLDFNTCKYTSSVMISETGLSKSPLDREFLRNELHITESASAKKVPLLYSLISSYKENHKRQGDLSQPSLTIPGNIRGAFQSEKDEDIGDGPKAVIVNGGRL